MTFVLGTLGLLFGIYFWVRLRQLEDRTRELRQDLQTLRTQPVSAPVRTSNPETVNSTEFTTPETMAESSLVPEEINLDSPKKIPDANNFGDWLRQDFLVKVGAFFVILGGGAG